MLLLSLSLSLCRAFSRCLKPAAGPESTQALRDSPSLPRRLSDDRDDDEEKEGDGGHTHLRFHLIEFGWLRALIF